MDSTYFGPQYLTGTNAGTTLYSSTKDVGFIGTMSGYDLDVIGMASNNGVLKGVLNEAAVTAAGTDMEVDINTGAFLVLGHPVRNTASAAVVIGANATGNPRIDRVVLRFTPKGQTEEGQFALAVLAGTAATSPSAPAPTTSSSVWEVSLAQVAVAAGATSISNANLTDERAFVGPTAVGTVIQALLDLKANLASPTFTGTVTLPATVVIPDGTLSQADVSGLVAALAALAPLASPTFTGTVVLPAVTAGGTITANSVAITPTELGYIGTLTSDAQTQISAKANSASPTLSNPTFTGTVTVPDAALAIADTSGLQAALDAKAPSASATFTGANKVQSDSANAFLLNTAADVTWVRFNSASKDLNVIAGDIALYTSGLSLVMELKGDTGNAYLGGDLKFGGSAPAITPDAGSTVNSVTGNDSAFTATVTTDASPPAADAQFMAVTFNTDRADANYVVLITPADSDAMKAGPWCSGSKTASGFVVLAHGAQTSASHILDILVIGR